MVGDVVTTPCPDCGRDVDLEVLAKEQGGRCFYCGRIPRRLVLDHALPLARGGPNEISNIRLACAPCNYRKWARTQLEFLVLLAS